MFIYLINRYVAPFIIFQVFQRRAQYVRRAKRERWMQLTVGMMSGESDGDDDERNLMVRCDTYIYQVVFIIETLCTFQPKNCPRHKQVMRRPLTDPPPSAPLAAK